jgi:hypothetical protein
MWRFRRTCPRADATCLRRTNRGRGDMLFLGKVLVTPDLVRCAANVTRPRDPGRTGGHDHKSAESRRDRSGLSPM